MTDFDKAMNDYYEHFGMPYPYAIGIGFKGETDEENIKIIREATHIFLFRCVCRL